MLAKGRELRVECCLLRFVCIRFWKEPLLSTQISAFKTLIAKSNGPRKGDVNIWDDCKSGIAIVLQQFYSAMREMEELRGFIASDAMVAHLIEAQTTHWQKLFAPTIPPDFEQRARKIGEAHVRTGLLSASYMAGYAFFLKKILPHLAKTHRFSPNAYAAAVDTLIERVFFDMILANSAYEHGVEANRSMAATAERNLHALQEAAAMVVDANETAVDLARLSRNTFNVHESSQTISAASTQLVASVEEISRNSEGAVTDANQTDHRVQFGQSAVNDVSSAIGDIAAAVCASPTTSEVRPAVADASSRPPPGPCRRRRRRREYRF